MNQRLAAVCATLAIVAAACGGSAPATEEVNLIGQISIGEEHGCLVERQYGIDGNGPDRSVIWCWGDGSNGELGDGTGAYRANSGGERLDTSGEKMLPRVSTGAVQVLGVENAVSVTVVSNSATCAVADDTGLYCWGESRPIGLEQSVWNSMGSTSGEAGENRRTPVKIMDGVERFAVAGITNTSPDDSNYACITRADLADTGVYCWGSGLGTHGVDYAIDWIDTPTLIGGLPEGLRAETLALAEEQGCALLEDQSVWCWARGEAPARVDERAYLSIEASEHRVCGVATDSALYCWGQGFTLQYGRNGYGSSFSSPTELDRFGLVSLSGLLSVGDEHVCVDYRRGVYCYGANDRGQLGDGGSRSREQIRERIAVRGLAYPNWEATLRSAMPAALGDESDYFEISAMSSSRSGACAVVYQRAVACWGAAPLVRPDVREDRDYLTPVVLTFNR